MTYMAGILCIALYMITALIYNIIWLMPVLNSIRYSQKWILYEELWWYCLKISSSQNIISAYYITWENGKVLYVKCEGYLKYNSSVISSW